MLPGDVEERKAFIGEIIYYGAEKVKILNVPEFRPSNPVAFYIIKDSKGNEFEEFLDQFDLSLLLISCCIFYHKERDTFPKAKLAGIFIALNALAMVEKLRFFPLSIFEI